MNNIVNKTDLGNGYTIEQLQSDDGAIYYRACHGGICRYCEDEYVAHMYIEHMGWKPE